MCEALVSLYDETTLFCLRRLSPGLGRPSLPTRQFVFRQLNCLDQLVLCMLFSWAKDFGTQFYRALGLILAMKAPGGICRPPRIQVHHCGLYPIAWRMVLVNLSSSLRFHVSRIWLPCLIKKKPAISSVSLGDNNTTDILSISNPSPVAQGRVAGSWDT